MSGVLVSTIAVALGIVNPDCTKAMVCQPGYTKTVRPPASFTNKLKKQQMTAWGLAGEAGSYEEDHLIPLELCGAPRDENNLRPQPWPEARKKDVDETRLHRALCRGQITLQEAQEEIRKKWGPQW